MMPAKGVGIGAAHKPMAEYRRKKGELCGHHWYIPNVRGTRELRHVRADKNYWKTFCHDRLVVGKRPFTRRGVCETGGCGCRSRHEIGLYGRRDQRGRKQSERAVWTANHGPII